MATSGLFSRGVDSSMIIHNTSCLRKLVAAYPRKFMERSAAGISSNLALSTGMFLSYGRGGVRVGRCWKTPILKAAIDGNGVGEDEDVSKDVLEVAIEKSKKVLEKQRYLLRLISERRRKNRNRIIDPEGFEQFEQLASNVDVAISSAEAAEGEVGKESERDLHAGTSSGTSFLQPIESTFENFQTSEIEYLALESNVKPIDGSSPANGLPHGLKNGSRGIISASITSEQRDAKNKSGEYGYQASPIEYEDSKGNADLNVQVSKSEDAKHPPLAGANVMNVILVACECSPWIKTGGLGDVAGALPKALARRGHRVMVIIPRYNTYADAQDTGVRKRYKVHGQDMEVNYFHSYIDGVDFVFVDSPCFRHLQDNIYGGKHVDVLKRMVLFCKVAVEVPWCVPCGGACYGDGNLVFIANDWHTALLPVYLKAYYRDHGLMQYTRTVLVIHNIAHQGRGPLNEFGILDLPHHYLDQFKFYDPVGGEHMNIFAAGIKNADRLVTVSHGYAWEIKTAEGGWGLHGIMNENDWKLRGIVNGIDPNDWSPDKDTHLQSDGYTNYSLDSLQLGKAHCKAALQRELGLPVSPDIPLIGFIGRLDHQKGVDIIAEAIPWMMSQDVQLVMLGTGRNDLEDMLRHLEAEHRGRIRGWVGFSVRTAHRITAGADILLMPSRFEPCGLNQLYAMRYGTVPVVHAVGGLRDTVVPFNPFEESGVGWTFPRAEAGELINALGNCLLTYREFKKSWEGLQRRGMMQDLTWDHAAEIYEEVLVAAKYQW